MFYLSTYNLSIDSINCGFHWQFCGTVAQINAKNVEIEIDFKLKHKLYTTIKSFFGSYVINKT